MKSSKNPAPERLKAVGQDKLGNYIWECQCDCGKKRNVITGELTRGAISSCGCSRKTSKYDELPTTLINSKTPEYNVWSSMIRRCTIESDAAFDNYGGRGIKVCERWLENFNNFIEDMGKRPSDKHSIDRINNNGNYELTNCRWTDRMTQARNQRTNKTNTSGYQGVHKLSRRYADGKPRWQARISIDKGRISLGIFKRFEDAVQARKEAELKYWGQTYDY